MKRVLISGYYGFHNLGDELLLRAIVQGLRERLPGLEICVASADPEGTARVHGVKAIARTDPVDWWTALGSADLLISGGGSLLQDVTGPWSIPYYAGVMALAAARGVPVMIFAQGIGPIRRGWSRRLARIALQHAAVVTVRDQGSVRLLGELGVEGPVEVVADPALLLEPAPGPSGPSRERGTVRRVALSIRRRALPPQALEDLAAGLNLLAGRRSLEWVLLPMEPAEDLKVCFALRELLQGEARVLDRPVTVDNATRLLQDCDFLLGMRLHSLILAAVAGMPMAGLSYDPKVDQFLQQIDAPLVARLPRLPTPARLADRLERILADAPAIGARLRQRLPGLRARAGRAFDLAAEILA